MGTQLRCPFEPYVPAHHVLVRANETDIRVIKSQREEGGRQLFEVHYKGMNRVLREDLEILWREQEEWRKELFRESFALAFAHGRANACTAEFFKVSTR